jgi:hypothetical protein
MALPAKILLLVYEHLPRTIKHTYMMEANDPNAPALRSEVIGRDLKPSSTFEIMWNVRHVSTSILATSRQVHKEAKGIVQNLIRTLILEHFPKVIPNLDFTSGFGIMLREIATEHRALLVRRLLCLFSLLP